MFDYEEDEYEVGSDDLDDFEYYVDFIKALEDEYVSKSDIVHELMNEFDLEQSQAVLVVKRYLREKSDWEDDYKEDIVPDDDYGDGNKEY
ncbi:hypothetical protein [Treponema zioleckii]|uniref:hypothetical protein n=1 Tax=Treponema zioleckii TaxID=331680 RepID=UPI00168B4A94|nr:hypothetical protein [Treponema zioleckii]